MNRHLVAFPVAVTIVTRERRASFGSQFTESTVCDKVAGSWYQELEVAAHIVSTDKTQQMVSVPTELAFCL